MSSDASAEVFVGLDWAACTHAVCLIDAAGSVLDRFEAAHDRDGLTELMRRLARHGQRLRIAIERPSGLIVDALVEAGHEVFPIHPNAVKASRPRYRSHGAKSDASDANLLADLLPTVGAHWPSSPTTSARCVPWCVRVTTWWPLALVQPTNSPAPCRPSGPALQ
jgi:hypothetical protein